MAELIKALHAAGSPLPFKKVVQLVRATAPSVAENWGGEGRLTPFLRKQLTGFGFEFDTSGGGYLWFGQPGVGKHHKDNVPVLPAVPEVGQPRDRPRAQGPASGSRSTSPPRLSSDPPTPAVHDLTLIADALPRQLSGRSAMPLSEAANVIGVVAPGVSRVWLSASMLPLFVQRYLSQFACTSESGQHYLVARAVPASTVRRTARYRSGPDRW